MFICPKGLMQLACAGTLTQPIHLEIARSNGLRLLPLPLASRSTTTLQALRAALALERAGQRLRATFQSSLALEGPAQAGQTTQTGSSATPLVAATASELLLSRLAGIQPSSQQADLLGWSWAGLPVAKSNARFCGAGNWACPRERAESERERCPKESQVHWQGEGNNELEATVLKTPKIQTLCQSRYGLPKDLGFADLGCKAARSESPALLLHEVPVRVARNGQRVTDETGGGTLEPG